MITRDTILSIINTANEILMRETVRENRKWKIGNLNRLYHQALKSVAITEDEDLGTDYVNGRNARINQPLYMAVKFALMEHMRWQGHKFMPWSYVVDPKAVIL